MGFWNDNEVRATRGRRFGFTVVELLVSVVVVAVAVMVTLLLANGMTRQLRGQTQSVTAQDNVRVAIDEITRTLRGAGSGTDNTNGQRRFVYAGPFTIAMNANLQPLEDPTGTGEPLAIDAALQNNTVPLAAGVSYTPPMTYGTGAETVVLTLDSNRDGVLSDADAGDDPEEDTENPNDYVLKTFIYGKAGGANQVTDTGLALLRGPSTAGDPEPEPLFRYWIDDDNDRSTAAVLHGDSDSDGRLSPTEAAAAGAVPNNQLGLVERVEIAATGESEKPMTGSEYHQTVMRSSVSFRNRSTTASRIIGVVFHDVDADGIRDAGELGIRDVIIRCSNGTRTKTNVDGMYSFVLTPGIYTLNEVDPPSYTSTTPNQVQINPTPGDYARVDFGDVSGTGTGRILGTVFSDADANGLRQDGERGIPGIRIFLDTGQSVYTDAQGRYSFEVQIQDYVVTEVDSASYMSVTPNVVDVILANPGDSVVVDFADHLVGRSGTIHGIVYQDDDNDGVKDAAEPGLANVSVTLDDATGNTTDSRGEFSFTVPPGWHKVEEQDPPGHSSSTVNVVWVLVNENQTVEVAFGDIAQQDITFQEIVLGNTERALSIASFETGEDNKADMDIVLGTHYVGGTNDVLVWWNKRSNSSTPNSAIFSNTADYARVIAADVNAVLVPDLNGDGRQDLISGLGAGINNIAVWLMQGTGTNKGKLPTSPTALYTAPSVLSISDVVSGSFDGPSGTLDIAVGSITGLNTGRLEVWRGGGGAVFTRNTGDVFVNVPGLLSNWGAVVSLASADFNADGWTDLVVGARTSADASKVYMLLHQGGSDANFALQATLQIQGALTDVLALDLLEDNLGDIDIVVATQTYDTAGRVELWHNRGDNHFGFGDFADEVPDDVADIPGSPLSLTMARFDNDVYPDLVVGTRSALYSGTVLLYRAYGYLPSAPQQISGLNVGEVITMTNADYNKDGAPDLAVGTRTSATSGKVVIYFNQRPAL